jgi:hypothetical protein
MMPQVIQMNEFNEAIAIAVVRKDVNSHRFERFSCDLLSASYEGGAPVLPTSASYDMARDGRGRGPTGTAFCCCSLTDRVDAKAIADVRRLVANAHKIDRLYFCSSQSLSEKQVNALEAAIRKETAPDTSVMALGALQLGSLARHHSDLLYHHYKGETADVVDLLRSDEVAADPADAALRLALSIGGHEDSEQIRSATYCVALRGILSDGKSRTLGDCTRDVSHHFRLASGISTVAVKYYLDELASDGAVLLEGGRYTLTAKGSSAYAEDRTNAAASLLDGRRLVKEHITAELGTALADDQFDRLWKLLQDKLALLFYERGLSVLQAVQSLLGGTQETAAVSGDFEALAAEIAEVAATVSSDAVQRDELRTAVVDLLRHPQGETLQWLLRVCCAYVCMCTLGVEAHSGGALARLISKISLVLDTDVVLALLNEGEAYHESAVAVVRRWRALGGEVLLAAPVLSEVAYHAWIAGRDFEQVQNWLPGTESDRDRLIENSFVRGFGALMAQKKATLRHWSTYIGQFRGASEYDASRLVETLKADHGVDLLPSRGDEEADLQERVGRRLRKIVETKRSGRALKIARDKAARDADLYSAMVTHRRNARSKDPESACLLVSSARRLSRIEAQFAAPGEPHFVVPLAGVVHMLTLVPNARLSLGSMRAILFDRPGHRFADDLERVVLRVVRDSSAVDVPWARRTTLTRELRNRIVASARSKGQRVRDAEDRAAVQRTALQPSEVAETGKLLKDALDALAIDSRLQIENASLTRELERLRTELEQSRRAKK